MQISFQTRVLRQVQRDALQWGGKKDISDSAASSSTVVEMLTTLAEELFTKEKRSSFCQTLVFKLWKTSQG